MKKTPKKDEKSVKVEEKNVKVQVDKVRKQQIRTGVQAGGWRFQNE